MYRENTREGAVCKVVNRNRGGISGSIRGYG